MNVQGIMQIIESPFPLKLIIEIGLLSIFLSLRKKDTEGYINGFLAAIMLGLIRDVIFAVFPISDIFFISDIFIFSLCVFLSVAPFGSKLPVGFAFVSNLIVAIIITANMVSPFLLANSPVAFRAFLWIDCILILVFCLIRRKTAEAPSQIVIVRSFPLLTAFFAGYILCVMLLGYENRWFQLFAVPLFYGWYLVVALNYIRVNDEQIIKALDYYESSISSIYNLFLGTGTALKTSFSVEEILDSMNKTIMEEIEATGGIVFLADEFDDLVEVKSLLGVFPPPFILPESLPKKARRVESYMRHLQLKPGETILGEVAHTGMPIFLPVASRDPRIALNGDDDFLKLATIIILPLMVDDRIIGVIAVCRSGMAEAFSEQEFDRAKILTNFGTLAINNFFSFSEQREKTAVDRSAGIAAEIQHAIIPKRLPEVPNLSFGAFTMPAKGVSGDYYDIIQTRKDRIVLAIGDVAGKGVSAALVMVMVRSILHLVANTDKDIKTVLTWINRGITGKIDMDHYATVGLLGVDTETGEVEYSNANHQPLLIYRRATDSIETMEIKSLPIGVERNGEYARKTFRLESGDVVVMYTDGIVEAMNSQGKQFGRKNLGNVVSRNSGLNARDIATHIKTDLALFVGTSKHHDDQTVLVMKMKQQG